MLLGRLGQLELGFLAICDLEHQSKEVFAVIE